MSGANPDLKNYWKSFIEQIDDRYWLIFGLCFNIFSEAVLCYQAKAYLASCIMCRSSVEAMLYLAKTITKYVDGTVGRHTYGSQKDKYPSFTQLIEWAKREHLLDRLESKVDKIQNDGDFVAHLVQKMDQQFADRIEITAQISKSPEKEKMFRYLFGSGIQLWISPGNARQRILDTAEVILQVTHRKWDELV